MGHLGPTICRQFNAHFLVYWVGSVPFLQVRSSIQIPYSVVGFVQTDEYMRTYGSRTFLFGSMFTSALFYQRGADLTLTQSLYVGVVSALITVVPVAMLVFVFKRSVVRTKTQASKKILPRHQSKIIRVRESMADQRHVAFADTTQLVAGNPRMSISRASERAFPHNPEPGALFEEGTTAINLPVQVSISRASDVSVLSLDLQINSTMESPGEPSRAKGPQGIELPTAVPKHWQSSRKSRMSSRAFASPRPSKHKKVFAYCFK